MKLRLPAKHIPSLATALVMVGLYVAGSLAFPRFFSLRVAVNLLGDNAFLGVAAIGATFVILSGGIDLSVGSVVAFTGILIAKLIAAGTPPLVALAIALAVGTLFGAVMGGIIHFFELPSFLVTLAGMFFARGMGFVVNSQSLGIDHPLYQDTISQSLAFHLNPKVSFPFTATCFVISLAVAIFVAHFTRFGRTVYAVGGDENSARLMGLPVTRTKILIYALSGFCSALAGVVATFYMQSGNPALYVGLELDAIAAVVIGGTLLSGGVGSVVGTAMGVLILGLIQTLITFKGDLNTWWTKIAVGALILIFILLQNVVSAASARASGRAKS